MLSISRLAVQPVHRIHALSRTGGIQSSIRLFTDDAGPSRPGPSFKKTQRRALQESIATGRATKVSDFSLLNNILEGDSRPPPRGRDSSDRQPRFGDRKRDDRPWDSDRPRYGDRSQADRPRRFEDRADRSGYRDNRRSGRFRDDDGERPFVRGSRDGPRGRGEAEGITPHQTSAKIKKWMQRNPSPLSQAQVEEAIKMVTDAPKRSVNTAVWNQILALLGREKKYQRMWKSYNLMKKAGIMPTARTFTTLLNAYAGLSHSDIPGGPFTPLQIPERLTLDRVRLIYDQSQRHIENVMKESEPEEAEDLGVAYPEAEEVVEEEPEVNLDEVNITPTNSYLKFLGRFGMWDEMKRVFLAMSPSGSLAPDQITYWTMLMAANNIDRYRRANPEEAEKLPQVDIGPTAKLYWDQAVRQLCPINVSPAERDPKRFMDEQLVLVALQCFAAGRLEDQRLVENLIPRVWGLSSHSQPAVVSSKVAKMAAHPDLPAAYAALPTFTLSVRSATSLMSIIGRMRNRSMAAHYTHAILDRPHLQKDFDMPALRVAIHNFANAQDVDSVRSVLDSYQPSTGKDGWPLDVWLAALSAARWSADWEAALSIFRTMAHLPPGVELGRVTDSYKFTAPNGRPRDIRGKQWVEGRAHRPDTTAASTLMKTAVATGLKSVRQAFLVLEHYGFDHWWIASRPGAKFDLRLRPRNLEMNSNLRKMIADRLELANDVADAAERLLVDQKNPQERERIRKWQETAQAVTQNYGGLVKR